MEAWLRHNRLNPDVHAVGHRMLFGGDKRREPQLIAAALEELVAIDPDHLARTLGAIRSTRRHSPKHVGILTQPGVQRWLLDGAGKRKC